MPSPAEPTVRRVGRAALDPASQARLVPRQLAWGCAQAAVLSATLAVPALRGWPDVGWALALGLGVSVALLPHPGRALTGGLAVVAATLLAGALGDGSSTLSLLLEPELAERFSSRGLAGVQVLLGGAAAGVALAALDGGPREPGRLTQVGLAGAAVTGLGWWAAQALVPSTWATPAAALAISAITAVLCSQALVFAALRFRTVDRIPLPRRLKATLRETYLEPCLRAWRLDQQLGRQAPDDKTRDGLGEVAAWIYRLQWTLQHLDSELTDLDPGDLEARITATEEQARATDDRFTKERRQATAGHLRQLRGHRDALAAERDRTAALVDYAGAFLEEARAGLALARVQPGQHAPGALPDVLDRLRTHGAEGEARRRSARELSGLSA